jgi:hypothetical protein
VASRARQARSVVVQPSNDGAQPRAARERPRDFRLRGARLVGCSTLLAAHAM